MQITLSEHFSCSKLVKFTMPTIVMMIFTSIYGVVDGLFISNCVGSKAFAGVNLIMPALMIVGSVGFMIGSGGSALVSKTLGEKKYGQASEIFSMLIKFLIVCGIILSIVCFIFMKPIAITLGAKGDLIEYSTIYGKTLVVSMTAFILQNCFQSFLVVAEKPKLGLVVSILAGVTNMVFDFLFVYVFKLGVFGAAVATGLSQLVGAIVPLIYFLRKNDSLLNLDIIRTKFKASFISKACINGSSEMVTNMSLSLVNMLYNLQLMKYAGSDGVVAYGIIMYVNFIFVGTYMGYSVGSAPIISYNYGAGNKAELKSLFKKSISMIIIASVVMTACAELLSGTLAGIFVGYDKLLHEMTTTAIRLFSISYIMSGLNIFASAFFTALNNGFVSAAISFLRTFVFQIAFIFILPHFWQLKGIWLAVVFAELLSLFVSFVFVLGNRKKYGYI